MPKYRHLKNCQSKIIEFDTKNGSLLINDDGSHTTLKCSEIRLDFVCKGENGQIDAYDGQNRFCFLYQNFDKAEFPTYQDWEDYICSLCGDITNPEVFEKKRFLDSEWFVPVGEKDIPSNRIKIERWQSYDGTEICHYPYNCYDPLNPQENLISNFKNLYTMSKTGQRSLMQVKLDTIKGRSIDVCGLAPDGTAVLPSDLQAITDAEIAAINSVNPPDSGYVRALAGFEVEQHSIGSIVRDDLTNENCTVKSDDHIGYGTSDDDGTNITVGQTDANYVGPTLPEPDDCGCIDDPAFLFDDSYFVPYVGDADDIRNGTTGIFIPENAAGRLCPIYVCVKEA